jgi:hypothetical protein
LRSGTDVASQNMLRVSSHVCLPCRVAW